MGDKQSPQQDDRSNELLDQLARASAQLLHETAPLAVLTSDRVNDLWRFPLLLLWQLQLRYLLR
jgi:hypothetical protein